MSNSIFSSPSPIDIKSLLVEFDASGLSAAAFARSKGLPSWKIYWALQRRSGKIRVRRTASLSKSNVLLPVHVVADKPDEPPAALELLLAGGHRVLLRADFDPQALRRLLAALSPC